MAGAQRSEKSALQRLEFGSSPLREAEVKEIPRVRRRHTESINASIPGGFYSLLKSAEEHVGPSLGIPDISM